MAHASEHPEQDWQHALDTGDETVFRDVVRPHLDALTRAARQDLDFYVAQGYLHERDLTPEEVVGEGLIQAWDRRARRPAPMSLRGWLLGIQYRVLRGLVERQRAYREQKAVSLDEPLPPNSAAYDAQEWFWDWYRPDAELTWEDVTPGDTPVDLEVSLEAEGLELDPSDSYHVLMMHDEFEMSIPEVAFIMSRTARQTVDLLERARATDGLRPAGQRDETRLGVDEFDHPAPPRGE